MLHRVLTRFLVFSLFFIAFLKMFSQPIQLIQLIQFPGIPTLPPAHTGDNIHRLFRPWQSWAQACNAWICLDLGPVIRHLTHHVTMKFIETQIPKFQNHFEIVHCHDFQMFSPVLPDIIQRLHKDTVKSARSCLNPQVSFSAQYGSLGKPLLQRKQSAESCRIGGRQHILQHIATYYNIYIAYCNIL